MIRSASLLAPAKVNLLLQVLGRRADGFHEIRTEFQSVNFGDRVSVSLEGIGITLDVDGPDLGPLDENLAHRAAVEFAEVAGLSSGIRVRLEKHIPAGAGLGGGSSDASAVLRLLNHLTDHPLSIKTLMEIGAHLGSDVPFFLANSPRARAFGRGEALRALAPLPACAVTLLVPPTHVATGPAYEALGRGPVPEGDSQMDTNHADSCAEVIVRAENDFEVVVSGLHTEVRLALDRLAAESHALVMLSGSGGACFALDPAAGVPVEAEVTADAADGWLLVKTSTLMTVPSVME